MIWGLAGTSWVSEVLLQPLDLPWVHLKLTEAIVWGHSVGERRSWGSTAQSTCLLARDHGHFTDEKTKKSKSSRIPENQRHSRSQGTSTSRRARKLPTRRVSLHPSSKGRVLTLQWCNQRQDSMSWDTQICTGHKVDPKVWLEGKPNL